MWHLVLHLAGAEYGYEEGGPRDALGSAMSAGAELVADKDGLSVKAGHCALPEYVSLRNRYMVPNRAAIIKVLKLASAYRAIEPPEGVEAAADGWVRYFYEGPQGVISIVEKAEEEL
jgi:hypothetical protein